MLCFVICDTTYARWQRLGERPSKGRAWFHEFLLSRLTKELERSVHFFIQ